jgi:putative Holliday junction resolvase
MSRILAVDYGLKRTGLAVTDPSRIIATALTTVETHKLIEYLKNYFLKESVDVIVVGMPLNLNNKATHTTEPVKRFVNQIKQTFPDKEVTLQDERFTTREALEAMITGGMKKKERRKKENVDKISATIILQLYMERTKQK